MPRQERASPRNRARPPRRPATPRTAAAGDTASTVREPVFYGQHAVVAALTNPARRVHCLYMNAAGESRLRGALAKGDLPTDLKIERDPGSRLLRALEARGAVHQGIAAEVAPLTPPTLGALTQAPVSPAHRILMLDQVTDPHNLGACFRSAAAFGVKAIITQDRHSPHETGALAKAASGMLEQVPWLRAGNLARTLETLKNAGYWSVGLAGDCDVAINTLATDRPLVLVAGAEDTGLRPLVRSHMDECARIPMAGSVESLNISVAAAIALYALHPAKCT